MTSKRFWAIVVNSLQKEVRNKVFWVFMALTVLMIIMTDTGFDMFNKFMKQSAPMLDISSKKLATYTMMANMWSSLLALYFGLNALRSDEEAGVTPFLLSFPIPRDVYVGARVVGAFLLSAGQYLFCCFLALLVFARTGVTGIVVSNVIYSLSSTLVGILGAVVLGVLLSFVLNRGPALIVAIIVYFMVSASNTTLAGGSPADHFSDFSVLKIMGLVFHYFLPRMGVWTGISTRYALDSDMSYISLPQEGLHLILVLCLNGLLISVLFRRKVL